MLRGLFVTSTPLICGILPFNIDSDDVVDTNTKTARQILENRTKESGMDRLRYMFTTDEFGNLSQELNSTLQVGFMGLFIGGVYGGIAKSRVAYMNFMENNQATTFKSHYEAKKKLQDQVTLSFGKGAFKWGWRLGAFSTSYVLISTCVSVYRGKSSIYEYLIGGGITGALYKFSMGPKGMLVGGGLGTCLGLVAGGLSLGLLKLAGMSMEDVRYWQYKFHEERQGKYQQAIKEHKEKDDLELLQKYSKKVAGLDNSLDNIK